MPWRRGRGAAGSTFSDRRAPGTWPFSAKSPTTCSATVQPPLLRSRRPMPPGPWPDEHTRLVRLVEIKPEVPALVVAAPQRQAQSALDYGSRCASALAATGAQVLLAVDRIIAATVGEILFAGRVGLTTHGGSVTGIRDAPDPVSAEPALAWDTADAVTITSLGDLWAGRYPAIDPLASHSAVASTDPRHRRIAAECRRALVAAAELRSYLVQSFWVAEEHTGLPGEAYTPDQTIAGLAELIDH